VAWNGSYWLAGGGYATSNIFAYSLDGSNWTKVDTNVFATECQGLTWNGRFWVAAGSSGKGAGGPNFAYSTDGISWTASDPSSALFTEWANGVQWNGEVYVGCGQGSNGSLAYSYNGSNWFPASNNPFTVGGHITTCWSVAWNGAVWIAAGDQDLSDGARSMAYSYDGMTWTTLNNPLANAYAVASRRVLPYIGYSPAPPTTNLPFGIANNLTWTGTGIGDSYQASISNVSPYLTTSSAIHYNVTCDSTNLADAMSCWIFSANPTNMSGGSITFYSQNSPSTPSNFPITWSVKSFATPFLPTITNLFVSYYVNSNAYLIWTETGAISRSVSTEWLSGDGGSNTPTVADLTAGSCTITGVYNDNYNVIITVSNIYGSASAAVVTSIPCFLGFVKLQTREGPVAAEDVTLGMEMLQPDGSYSRVMKTASRVVTEHTRPADARLFADPSENMVVTSWHKIRFSDEAEEKKADEHPRLHEVFREMPFPVYHFHLEHYTHKILIHDTDIIAESFVPVNPA